VQSASISSLAALVRKHILILLKYRFEFAEIVNGTSRTTMRSQTLQRSIISIISTMSWMSVTIEIFLLFEMAVVLATNVTQLHDVCDIGDAWCLIF
jgi:hypothetical protein